MRRQESVICPVEAWFGESAQTAPPRSVPQEAVHPCARRSCWSASTPRGCCENHGFQRLLQHGTALSCPASAGRGASRLLMRWAMLSARRFEMALVIVRQTCGVQLRAARSSSTCRSTLQHTMGERSCHVEAALFPLRTCPLCRVGVASGWLSPPLRSH